MLAYVEEADDAANKVSQRKRNGISGDRVYRNTWWSLLPLLPSGPDGVHKPPLRGTRPHYL